MKLCLPKSGATDVGGMHSFFLNFRTWLQERGLPFTQDPDGDWDVLCANSWAMPYGDVRALKRARPAARVLHRIDGSAVDYGRVAPFDVRQALVNACADVTVFQSRYGYEATHRRRVILADGPIIHNPVDVERFRPDGERATLPGALRVAHVSFQTNPKKGVAGVYELARRRRDLTFVMVGRYEAPPALPNLEVLDVLGWDRLPAVLRGCQVMLTLSENDTCSNSVIEGLASGLPVLYLASGGTPELVGDAGAPVTVGTFDAALAGVIEHRDALAAAARRRAVERFSFDVIFPRYIAAAASARRRPVPSWIDAAAVLARMPAPPGPLVRWLTRRLVSRLRPRRPREAAA